MDTLADEFIHVIGSEIDPQEELDTSEPDFHIRNIRDTKQGPEREDTVGLVAGKDVHQLYFVYLTSSREDWHYILQSKGLGQHCDVFDGTAPFDGRFVGTLDGKLDYPDAILKRTPSDEWMFDQVVIDAIEPEVLELEGIPAHLTLEQFTEALQRAVPDWTRFRNFVPAPRQHIAQVAQVAMVSDLLAASALPSSAAGLLNAMAASSSQTAVFASVEGGHVSNSAARSVWCRDGSMARVMPNKLPFRILDVYNGPILVSCIEERSGYVVVKDEKREGSDEAGGLASDFVKGFLCDTYSKQAVLKAISTSISYSNLLKRLLHAGFDLAPSTGHDSRVKNQGNSRCWRIQQGPVVVGALWDRRGLFACLRWQPSASDFAQEWGTVCVYRDDSSPVYVECWALYQRCRSTAEMRAELARVGYLTTPAPYSAHSVH